MYFGFLETELDQITGGSNRCLSPDGTGYFALCAQNTNNPVSKSSSDQPCVTRQEGIFPQLVGSRKGMVHGN